MSRRRSTRTAPARPGSRRRGRSAPPRPWPARAGSRRSRWRSPGTPPTGRRSRRPPRATGGSAEARSSGSPWPPPCQTGPTAWMMHRAGRAKPGVARASPVGQRPSAAHASARPGPAAAKIAPHTPPPASRAELAAFTMASVASAVMSPWTASRRGATAATLLQPARFRPEMPQSDINGQEIGQTANFHLRRGDASVQSDTVVILQA